MNKVRRTNGHTPSWFFQTFMGLLILTGIILILRNSPPGFAQSNPRPGILKLTIADADSGQPTPARVELLDKEGHSYIAEDALPVDGDCDMAQEEPARLTLERAVALLSKKVENPYTGTDQFYSVGHSKVSLPPASYKLTVASSTGRCNTSVKSFCRSFKLQRLTGPFVQLTCHLV